MVDNLKTKLLPNPPKLIKLIGPSFIMVGLGLGSGELILWPYLTSKFGMGIIWGAFLGITFQFFLNMEIERYTLAKGESVFIGLSRILGKASPIWFIVSTIIPWMWPGIIASSATLIAALFGVPYTKFIPIALLLFIGVALTLGPVIYKTQEIFQKTLILIGVPAIFIILLFLVKPVHITDTFIGLIGRGEGYWFFPAGISFASFIGAFAYAGAGGNLNLAQSFYIKEKGYGMGIYSGKITSILTGKKENIKLTGAKFEITKKNLKRFNIWWKRINIEHLLVFWATGLFTMIMLSLLSYITVYQKALEVTGINFVLLQAETIGQRIIPAFGIVFLIIASLMLFSTQFSVVDAASRIMSENLILFAPKILEVQKFPVYYYILLWSQIILGIIIFALGFTEPLLLVTIGAVLNAFTMFVYSGLLLLLNNKLLENPLKPNLIRRLILIIAFIFYGGFSLLTILQSFKIKSL